MSQALEQDTDDQSGTPAETDIETRARAMGWKPKDEYRGPPGAWRDAATFVAKGENDLPILRERSRKLEQDLTALRRGQEESTAVVLDLTERLRSADERAYKKALAKLEAEREQAVEAGDTAAFRAAEKELNELKEAAPPPPPERKTETKQPPPPPESIAWAEREPWFRTDPVLATAAHRIHEYLLQTKPGLTLAQNLEEVSRRVRADFPEKFAHEKPDDDENPRRNEPSAVAGSTPTPRTNPKSVDARFAALPAESKEAFKRYSDSIKNKPNAKPLTKEEWLSYAEEG